MRVGIMVEGQEGLTWDRWFRLARAAEDLGYESLVRSDHLTGLAGDSSRSALDAWTSLTALATATRRIRFGPMVSPITFYHPAMLAKKAAALDQLSGGRLDLGLGAGWNEYEHRMFGIPFPALGERMDRLESGARLIRALEAGRPVTLDQPYYPLLNAESHPLPTSGRLRLVIGGRGERRTLRIVAEVADEWNVTRVTRDEFARKQAMLVAHCRALSRAPESIARSLMIALAIGADSGEVARRIAAAHAIFPLLPESEAEWRKMGFLVGSPIEVGQQLTQWEEVGVQRVVLQMFDQEDIDALELFARDVLPQLAHR
jgi:alkanesulfonate monooxygenase SsuD/methylene tetrahydromethanopterin reductase-like flavin-dependent oxidoreductase (luciferase family)